MIELAKLEGIELPGGFVIASVELSEVPMRDALGREAVAQTTIMGMQFHLILQRGSSEEELSISLYHEILEGVHLDVATI
jgi:hypothetical protein